MCKMGFISKRLSVRHLIGSIRQEAKDLHQRSTLSISGFTHYRSLAREGLVWTIPQGYIQIKRLDKGNNLQDLSLPFPSRESLWHAFNGGVQRRRRWSPPYLLFQKQFEEGSHVYTRRTYAVRQADCGIPTPDWKNLRACFSRHHRDRVHKDQADAEFVR